MGAYIAQILDRSAWHQRGDRIRPEQFAAGRIEIGHIAAGASQRDLAIGKGRCRRAEQHGSGRDAEMHPQLFARDQQIDLHVAVEIGDRDPVGCDD